MKLLWTAEAWEDVKQVVSARDVSDARLFLALLEATRQRLANEGKLLSEPVDGLSGEKSRARRRA